MVAPFLGAISTSLIWTCFFNLFQSFLQDQIRAISQDQVKTILESLTSTLEKGNPGPYNNPLFQTPKPSPLSSRK